MCSGGFFLFRGGCYKAGQAPGSEICTAASGGKCTTCKTEGNYIFQNKAASPTLGSECILCSDATDRDGVMGVANCHTCTAPGSAGAAACSACQEGYYKNGADKTCKPCQGNCATCTGSAVTNCETCKAGYYLKSDKSCSDTCDQGYADPESRTCKLCTTIDQSCIACKYNATVSKPQCTTCGSSKKVKTALDSTTICVDLTPQDDCTDANHFKTDDNSACYLCSNTSGDNPTTNKGVAQCKACTKQNGQAPVCSQCLDGYFYDGSSSTCKNCAANCATCTSAAINDCTAYLPGYFLKTDGSNKECISCGDTAKGGIDGCAECSGTTGSLKCTKCSPNRKPVGAEGTQVTCEEKTCEDETACGGLRGDRRGRRWKHEALLFLLRRVY